MERCVICGREPGPVCPECVQAEKDRPKYMKLEDFGNWNQLAPAGSTEFSAGDDHQEWESMASMSFASQTEGWPYRD